MTKIIQWEDIRKELGSDISQFYIWLNKKKPENITIFVTGIFEKDLREYRNEKRRNR